MNIFISWSGMRAKHIAKALHEWLPNVIQHARPWMSEEDIDPGARWGIELATRLESMKFGIVCLTPESINSPWVLFESGALAKALSESVVCPYLFDMNIDGLRGPMGQFNSVGADRQGTWRLIRSINKSLDHNWIIPEDRLRASFDLWWPRLETVLKKTPKQPLGASVELSALGNIGLSFLFPNRGPALEKFREHLQQEIDRAIDRQDVSISFVSTSMRGFLVPVIAGFDGQEVLKNAIEKKCQLRIMMAHPETAELRAQCEGRETGHITRDIQSSLGLLRNLHVPQESVRYYRMGPTVFGIATSDSMLLNPYPSSHESQRCFSIIVHKTQLPTDIYQQYKKHHFDELWEVHTERVPDTDWTPVTEWTVGKKLKKINHN